MVILIPSTSRQKTWRNDKGRLYPVKDYDGANGFITVDERGVGQRSEVSIKTAKGNGFVTIQ